MTLLDIPYGWTGIRGNDPTPGPIEEVEEEAKHGANRLKLQYLTTSQSDHMDHSLV